MHGSEKSAMRIRTLLNTGWCFKKTDAVPEHMPADWESVDLPHTWNAKDGQDGGNDYWRGTSCYARLLTPPDPTEGRRTYLEVSGAAMTAEVYLNGVKLARHEGGYSAFRVDLTEYLRDSNLLCITVDNSENDRIYPQKADFTFYGGLYRDVSLITVPERHFELLKDGTPGIRVTPKVDPENRCAEVTVETWQNGGNVTFCVCGEQRTVASEDGHASAGFLIRNVRLWNGLKDPFLYEASASLDSGDRVSLRFGCRVMSSDPERGFLLNGEPYPLRGVSRHQDRPGIGNALTGKEHIEDMSLILEMGANSVRLAHYQHSSFFYDLCDEKGLIVWAEIPYITEHMPNGRQNTLDQMRELITQCCSHPSIYCWGLSNEIAVHGVTEDLMENHRLLNDMCHSMDPTRPTAMAHAFMLEQDSPLVDLADVAGYNLYFGWYIGDLARNDSFLDEYRSRYPDRALALTEYGADANVKFQTSSPEAGDYSEQYQCVYHEYILGCIERHPWLWATYLWNMFDFAADGRDEGGARGLNQKGLVSFDRMLKKDAFYLYKAAWNIKEPFVHLCGRRYVNRAEEETEIRIYSNQPEVTLFVDGAPAGSQKGETVFVFRIEIHGEHRISAKAGGCVDEITIRKVSSEDLSYRISGSADISNWFDEDDFRTGFFSIRDSFGSLMAHPEAGKIVGELMQRIVASRGDVAKSANSNEGLMKMMSSMSLESLLKKAGDAVSKDTVSGINSQLQQIPKF